VSPPIQDRLHTPSSEEPLGFGQRSGIFLDGVAGVRTPDFEHQKRMLYPLHSTAPDLALSFNFAGDFPSFIACVENTIVKKMLWILMGICHQIFLTD